MSLLARQGEQRHTRAKKERSAEGRNAHGARAVYFSYRVGDAETEYSYFAV
jgi:hypothetical protein